MVSGAGTKVKRSEINDIVAQGHEFIRSFGVVLPPFAVWAPERMRRDDAALIRARGLGWDITDYGAGNFAEMGLFLFTTRNGSAAHLSEGCGMLYAEKIMISRRDQLSPMHRHVSKAEDIINKGGGDLIIELFASDPTGRIDRTADVTVMSDGCAVTMQAGGKLRLQPGQSVTLMPGDWHAFWAEREDCIIAEVSTVNDDKTDNIFEQPISRFAEVVEDVPATRLLVSDYA